MTYLCDNLEEYLIKLEYNLLIITKAINKYENWKYITVLKREIKPQGIGLFQGEPCMVRVVAKNQFSTQKVTTSFCGHIEAKSFLACRHICHIKSRLI